VYGAFEDNTLKAFTSVERGAFGSSKQYLDLTSLHVSEELRGKGIGRQLFNIAAAWAKDHGGRKLYISAHSSVESQAFYHAMGCMEAKEYSREHVEMEPYDCQMEYPLYPEEDSISYRQFDSSIINQVKEIFKRESWNSYLKDDAKLIRAFDNSLYILGAFDGDRLVGLIRCVGDGEHVLLVQDLIVDPPYQKRGIGSRLFKDIMDRYSEVRMFMVVTDIEDKVDNKFYQSFELVKVKDKYMVCYIR
jgi:GNAT superfamily N-acetyltransferase